MKAISGSSNSYSIKKEVFLSLGYVFLHRARSYDDIEGLYLNFKRASLKQRKTAISNNTFKFFQFLTTF